MKPPDAGPRCTIEVMPNVTVYLPAVSSAEGGAALLLRLERDAPDAPFTARIRSVMRTFAQESASHDRFLLGGHGTTEEQLVRAYHTAEKSVRAARETHRAARMGQVPVTVFAAKRELTSAERWLADARAAVLAADLKLELPTVRAALHTPDLPLWVLIDPEAFRTLPGVTVRAFSVPDAHAQAMSWEIRADEDGHEFVHLDPLALLVAMLPETDLSHAQIVSLVETVRAATD